MMKKLNSLYLILFSSIGITYCSNKRLDDWSDEDIKLCFRFERNDLPHLVEVLRIPHEVVTGTGNRVSGKNNMLLAVALKLQYKQ